AVGGDAEGGVMMKATPAAALIVAEPDLLLEFLIVAFDAPAQFGEIDQTGEADVLGQSRQPILCRLLLALGPFDQQPFLRPGLTAIEVTPGDTNTQARKARSERSVRSFPPCDHSPGSGRKAERKVFDGDWPMLGIAAQALGRPAPARRRGLGRQRPGAGRPHRGVRQNTSDIRQAKRTDRRAQIAMRPVA